MKRLLFIFCVFSTTTAFSQIKTEFSGNLEVQSRNSWNGDEAKSLNLINDQIPTQDWDSENFSLIYGNLNAKVDFSNSRLESNFFARHSKSDLYKNNYIAPLIFNFPNKLVAREVFKLQNDQDGTDNKTEYILNKF